MFEKMRIYVFKHNDYNDHNFYYQNSTYKNKIILILIILLILWLLGEIIEGFSKNFIQKIFHYIFFIPLLLFSLSFHEYSHALVADFLGDPTPRKHGRLSLNPLNHLDPLGTFMLLFTNFGWAKPVIVNPNNFRIPQRAMLFVALAGPLSNILLALCGALILKIIYVSVNYINFKSMLVLTSTGAYVINIIINVLKSFILLNLALSFFNLIPIPPLDGSRVLRYFTPYKYTSVINALDEIGPIVLLLAIMLGLINQILHPIVRLAYKFIINIVL